MKGRLCKVVLWRLVSVIITMLIMVLFTGSLSEATSLTFFLHAILTIANYVFEASWEKINEDR